MSASTFSGKGFPGDSYGALGGWRFADHDTDRLRVHQPKALLLYENVTHGQGEIRSELSQVVRAWIVWAFRLQDRADIKGGSDVQAAVEGVTKPEAIKKQQHPWR